MKYHPGPVIKGRDFFTAINKVVSDFQYINSLIFVLAETPR